MWISGSYYPEHKDIFSIMMGCEDLVDPLLRYFQIFEEVSG